MSSNNSMYWSYNLPLQVWFNEDDEDANSPDLENIKILNYMPRKERVELIPLSEVIGDQTREEFFNTAASYFDNLAKLMREAANGSNKNIYYHDAGMN